MVLSIEFEREIPKTLPANFSFKYLFFFTILFVLSWNTAFAQPSQGRESENDLDIQISEPRVEWLSAAKSHIHEFTIWGGYAFDSFKLWGKTPNATVGRLGLGYNRKFLRIGEQVIEYRFELNIFSKITYPEFEPGRNRTSLSGYGIAPLGFRINFRKGHHVQPFLGSSGGFMYLEGPFPDDRGEKFNYTLSAGGGIEILFNARSSFSLGYKYFHLSNGDNGQVNPGIDSSFFFVSFTFF